MKLPKRIKPILEDTRREIVLVAHRRWAKTLSACSKCVIEALKNKDRNYFIILPTYKQAKRVAWKMLKSVALDTGIQYKPNETELKITFVNGSFVQLLGSDQPDDIRGIAADGVWLDEWSLHKPSIYTEIIVPALMDRKGWVVKSFTPKGQNHAYEDFSKAVDPYFLPADKTGVFDDTELNRAREIMSPEEFEQEMLCKFLTYSGLVYNNFSDNAHIVKPFEIPAAWTRLVGIDYGLTNPTAIPLMAVDYDGCVYVYDDDIYETDTEVASTAKMLKDKVSGLNYYPYIDPSTIAQDQSKKLPDGSSVRYSIFQEFQDNGVERLVPAINSVRPGINKIKTLLTQNKLKIFSTCTNVLLELRNYRWKVNKNKEDANNPEQPVKVNDHMMDAIRYAIATYFENTPQEAQRTEKFSPQWFDLMEEKQRKRSRSVVYA